VNGVPAQTDPEPLGSARPQGATGRASLARSRALRFAIRAGLGILPLYFISQRLDRGQLVHVLERLQGGTLLLSFLAPLAAVLVGAVRWRVLLFVYGVVNAPPLGELCRQSLSGYYFNMLPGGFAGDALRAVWTRRASGGIAQSATVVIAERLAGFAGLLALAAATVAVSRGLGGGGSTQAAIPAALVAVGAVTAIAALVLAHDRWMPATERGPFGVLGRALRRIPSPGSLRGVLAAIGLSLVTQGITMAQIVYVVHQLSPAVDPRGVAERAPLLILLTYVRLTPGAIGQRELVFSELLRPLGVPLESAVSTSLVVLAAQMAVALLGGAVAAVSRKDFSPPAFE